MFVSPTHFTPPQNLAQHVDALGALRVGERRGCAAPGPLLSTAARHLYQMSTTLSYIASAFSTWFIEKKTLAKLRAPHSCQCAFGADHQRAVIHVIRQLWAIPGVGGGEGERGGERREGGSKGNSTRGRGLCEPRSGRGGPARRTPWHCARRLTGRREEGGGRGRRGGREEGGGRREGGGEEAAGEDGGGACAGRAGPHIPAARLRTALRSVQLRSCRSCERNALDEFADLSRDQFAFVRNSSACAKLSRPRFASPSRKVAARLLPSRRRLLPESAARTSPRESRAWAAVHDVPLRLALAHLDECVLSRLSGLKRVEPPFSESLRAAAARAVGPVQGAIRQSMRPTPAVSSRDTPLSVSSCDGTTRLKSAGLPGSQHVSALALREGQRVELLDGVLHGGMRKQ